MNLPKITHAVSCLAEYENGILRLVGRGGDASCRSDSSSEAAVSEPLVGAVRSWRRLFYLFSAFGRSRLRSNELPPGIETEQAYGSVHRHAATLTKITPAGAFWSLLPERMPPANQDAPPPFVDVERWYVGEVRAGRPERLHPYGPGAYTIVVDGRELSFPTHLAYQTWQAARNSESQRQLRVLRCWKLIRHRV